MKNKLFLAYILTASFVAANMQYASATNLDCTLGCNQTVFAGGVFSTTSIQPAGTGNLNTFVQIQQRGTEQGYNTTVNGVFNNGSSDNFNREIKYSDVGTKVISGINYLEFLLDVNESNNGTDNYLSLDGLQIYSSNTPNQSTTTVSSLGTLIYDLDSGANNAVLLDYAFNGSGSGVTDLFVYIPVSLFGNVTANGADPYLYLWSQFGLLGVVGDKDFGSGSGFEEWATRKGDAVPEPATLALLGFGILAGAGRKRLS